MVAEHQVKEENLAAYMIFTEAITDPDGLQAYAAKAVPTVLQYGGIPRIASGAVDVLEGEWHGQQTVMLEFESVEAANAWYNSAEYQAVIGERHAAATSNGAIFEQFSMPGS